TAQVTVEALDALNNEVPLTSLNVTVSPDGSTVSPVAFLNGAASFTVTFSTAGTFNITATSAPLSTNSGPIVVGAAPPPTPPTKNLTGTFALGTGNNGSPTVSIFNGDGSPLTSFIPFPPGFNNEVDPTSGGFTGGIRVAVGDVTGDGVADYVVGTGPGITATVVVIDGHTGQKILTYFPFDTFQGGVFVAVGDVNHDGVDEIAITPDQGGGPRVVLLNGGNFNRIGNFFGINDPGFRGGARAAIGDINGDGFSELVVSAGFGGGPRISVFDGAALARGVLAHPVGDFFLFDPSLRNGAYVAVGDVNADGFADIIGGAGPGGGPQVYVVSGKTLLQQGPVAAVDAPLANFFGGDPNNRGGIPVAAKNIDGDNFADILVGAGDGGGATAAMYRGVDVTAGNINPDFEINALPGYSGGVFVG
ncbi:MAG TPA: FG-GAP-like repeat-containing protein, partial [Urbifossiella sp.]|nr:FG-GAP-like repeat-containing protein [Urbifossiella sp.]